jgi:hypothetical protein
LHDDALTFLGEPPATEDTRRTIRGRSCGRRVCLERDATVVVAPDVHEGFAKLRSELMGSSLLTERDWADAAPEQVRNAVTYGRAPAAEPSGA